MVHVSAKDSYTCVGYLLLHFRLATLPGIIGPHIPKATLYYSKILRFGFACHLFPCVFSVKQYGRILLSLATACCSALELFGHKKYVVSIHPNQFSIPASLDNSWRRWPVVEEMTCLGDFRARSRLAPVCCSLLPGVLVGCVAWFLVCSSLLVSVSLQTCYRRPTSKFHTFM